MPTSHGKIELIICSVHSEYQLLIIWGIHTNNDFTDYNRLFPASTSTSSSKVDTMGTPTRLMVAEGWVGHLFQTLTSFGSIWHIDTYQVTMLPCYITLPYWFPVIGSCPFLFSNIWRRCPFWWRRALGEIWHFVITNKQNWYPMQLIFTSIL